MGSYQPDPNSAPVRLDERGVPLRSGRRPRASWATIDEYAPQTAVALAVCVPVAFVAGLVAGHYWL